MLNSLDEEELRQLFERAAANGALDGLSFDDAAIDTLTGYADGDARRFLNLLEQTRTAAYARKAGQIDRDFLSEVLTVNARRFDKGGDDFYDQISALHKSVRGSNPDAALYWLTRMLDGGADARYLARRLVRMAWEDIGLADPRAMQIANEAAATYERLGGRKANLRWLKPRCIWPWPPRAMPVTRRIMRPAPSSSRTNPGRCRYTCAMRPLG